MAPSAKGESVKVVFKTPYSDWQSLFNDLMPAHVLGKTGWNPTCSTVSPSIDLSAGPFVISKVVPKHEIVLVRNRRWWEQEANLAKLVIRIASGPKQLAQWLANGTVDVAVPSGYNEAYLQSVTSQPSLFTQNEISTTFLQLEFSTTSPVTASVDVREAIAHAVDRQALVKDVIGWENSMIVPATSHLFSQSQHGYPSHRPPPLQISGQPGYTRTTVPKSSPTATPFPLKSDRSATDHLLTGLGYTRPVSSQHWLLPTGGPFVVRMAVDDSDTWAQRAAAQIVHQLGDAGISVTIVPEKSTAAAGEALSSGRADMTLIPMHSSPYPSQAIAWYTPLLGPAGTGGSQDWSNLDDTAVNRLLEKATEELNPVDASPLYSQVDAALWQEMVGLPLFTEPGLVTTSGITAGVSATPDLASLLWAVQTWNMRVPPTSPDAQS